MNEVLNRLSRVTLVYWENVEQLRTAISKRYPNETSAFRSAVFAKAIHQIVDKQLLEFDPENRKLLKQALLQQAFQKDTFCINASDVVKCYQNLNFKGDTSLEALASWVSHHDMQTYTPEQIKTLLNKKIYPLVALPKEQVANSTGQKAPDYVASDTSAPYREVLHQFTYWLSFRKALIASILLLIIGFPLGLHLTGSQSELAFTTSIPLNTLSDETTEASTLIETIDLPDNHLHNNWQYKTINEEALYNWLSNRNSLLAEDPYFGSIIDVAKEYNINPLLMFAITGQEQGFVPKNHPHAITIANNPFNVYGSWEDFNTSIADTSKIAARTILTLSEGCPEGEDPFKWLNKKYAEDPNWHKGVSSIFANLEEVAALN